MNTDKSSNENSKESKANVVTESEIIVPGLSENPDIVINTVLELSTDIILKNKSDTEETHESTNNNHLTDEEKYKLEVTFASAHQSISYEPEEETLSVVSLLLEEYLTASFFIHLPQIFSLKDVIPVEFREKFTQTFFKAMTKLSNRRFVEIINIRVDHEDPTLVFFCPSYELLTSFHENEDNINN